MSSRRYYRQVEFEDAYGQISTVRDAHFEVVSTADHYIKMRMAVDNFRAALDEINDCTLEKEVEKLSRPVLAFRAAIVEREMTSYRIILKNLESNT